MKKRWSRYLMLFLVVSFLGGILLRTSQNVQRAEDDLHIIRVHVENEEEAIRVLQAEWSYLNRPDRLEELAVKYLDLQPPRAAQMVSEMVNLPEHISVPSPGPDEKHRQAVVFKAPVVEHPASVLRVKPRQKPRRQPVHVNDGFGDLLKRLDKEGAQ